MFGAFLLGWEIRDVRVVFTFHFAYLLLLFVRTHRQLVWVQLDFHFHRKSFGLGKSGCALPRETHCLTCLWDGNRDASLFNVGCSRFWRPLACLLAKILSVRFRLAFAGVQEMVQACQEQHRPPVLLVGDEKMGGFSRG